MGQGVGDYQRKPWLLLAAAAPKTRLQKLTICQSTLPGRDHWAPTLEGLGVAPPGGLVSVHRIDRPPGGPGRKPGSACLM